MNLLFAMVYIVVPVVALLWFAMYCIVGMVLAAVLVTEPDLVEMYIEGSRNDG